MADKSTRLMLEALSRAATQPAGMPLFAPRSGFGLFPATSSAKQAAQRCVDDGLLSVATGAESAVITDKGRRWLLSEISPRQVLEDFVRVLEEKQTQAADLVASAQAMNANIESLRHAVETIRPMLNPPEWHHTAARSVIAFAIETEIVQHLERWREQSSGDCPLPDLLARLREDHAGLTIGGFHDALRRLHEVNRIYLHPWTGPLYALPEPPCALLIGHEIAYYASACETPA